MVYVEESSMYEICLLVRCLAAAVVRDLFGLETLVIFLSFVRAIDMLYVGESSMYDICLLVRYLAAAVV